MKICALSAYPVEKDSNLGLAQIHAALAYYFDHQQELDEDIQRRRDRVAEFKAEIGDSKVRERLKQLGHLH